MTMLGAQLDDLTNLSSRLRTTAGDVSSSREQSIATTTQVISEVSDAARRALDQITSHMQALDGSVGAAVAQAEATQWTGANADRFRGGAAEFRGAMQAGQTATTEAFGAFQTSVASMTETLDQFVAQFSSALTGAEASTNEMATAVEAQHANLDQAMNIGLSFG